MKRKLIGVVVMATIITTTAAWNFNQRKNEIKLSELVVENINALASCESEVQHGCGRSANLECVNSRGEKYTIKACDFDMAYSTDCEGKSVN